jgi:hypothetical protein
VVAKKYLTKAYQLDSKLNKISLKVDKAIKTTIIIVIIKIIASGRRGGGCKQQHLTRYW